MNDKYYKYAFISNTANRRTTLGGVTRPDRVLTHTKLANRTINTTIVPTTDVQLPVFIVVINRLTVMAKLSIAIYAL